MAYYHDSNALAQGLALGMRYGENQQEHDLALRRLAQAQALADQRTALDRDELNQREQFRRDAMAQQQAAQARADQQDAADRQLNTSEFTDLSAADQLGDWTQMRPEDVLATGQGIQRQAETFAQASPHVQQQYLQPMRHARSMQIAADLTRRMADEEYRRKLGAVLNSNLPKPFRDRQVQRLMLDHSAKISDLPMSMDEFNSSPLMQALPEQYRQPAAQMYAQTGEPPPSWWLDGVHRQTTEGRLQQQQQQQAAHQHFLQLQAINAAAVKELDAFSKANAKLLAVPVDDPTGKDQDWAKKNRPALAAQKQLTVLQQRVSDTGKAMQDAMAAATTGQASQQQAGPPMPTPPPTATGQAPQDPAMLIEQAVHAVYAQHPELDPSNPQDQARFMQMVNEMVSGQPRR